MIERLQKRSKELRRLGFVVGTLATGLAFGGCGTTVSFEKARAKAVARYDHAFNHTSPAGRYLIQYLRITQVAELRHSGFDDGGVAERSEFDFGDGCLQGTAYDIAGGRVTASAGARGLFSSSSASAEASVPSAAAYAELDQDNPDKLLVRSGHDNSVDLHFTNAEGPGRMIPVDPSTENILRTYGCQRRLNIKHTFFEIGDYAKTSSYIK